MATPTLTLRDLDSSFLFSFMLISFRRFRRGGKGQAIEERTGRMDLEEYLCGWTDCACLFPLALLLCA